jgi:hypothetical protein
MAGPRETGLRRAHVRAIPLCRCVGIGVIDKAARDVDFRLACPDSRVSIELAVLFQPDPNAWAHPEPANAAWGGLFDPASNTGLAVMARESGMEQGARSLFAQSIFGRLSALEPLPGDTFGWMFSRRSDGREWYGRLHVEGPAPLDHPGTWIAKVTATDATGNMTGPEWERVADKLRLEGDRPPTFNWARGA